MTMTEQVEVRRRTVMKAFGVGAGAVVTSKLPSFVDSVSATESLEVITVEAESDIPEGEDFSVSLTVQEYLDGADDPTNEQTISLDDGEHEYEYDELEGEIEFDSTRDERSFDGEYQFVIELTGDGDNTPEVNPFTIKFPFDWDLVHQDDPFENQPEHVEILFDQQMLRRYEPRLIMNEQTRRRHKGLYGYVARSDEYDYDVCCYWSQLTHQDGLPIVRADSSFGDHEPIYVFVDKETEQIHDVIYTAYHWYASQISVEDSPDSFIRDRDDDSATHIVLGVVDPWHHYTRDVHGSGVFLPLRNWLNVRDDWADSNMYEAAQNEAIEDPMLMRDRNSWWQDDSTDSLFAELWRMLGLRGGAQADELKGPDAGGYTFSVSDLFPFLTEDDTEDAIDEVIDGQDDDDNGDNGDDEDE